MQRESKKSNRGCLTRCRRCSDLLDVDGSPAAYEQKTIYFLPECEPKKPVGTTGGNPYGVLAVNPDKHPGVNYELAMKFVNWIVSADTQKKIGSYGVDRFGQPLFYPSANLYVTPGQE